MITLKQIYNAIEEVEVVDGDKEKILAQLGTAIQLINDALNFLNELQVKGRQNVDALLGCMMAIEAIMGEAQDG